MELEFLTGSIINLSMNLVYTILALLVGVVSLKYIDNKLLKDIDIVEEIKKGNIAASIFGSTILIFIAIIIASSMK